MNIGHSTMDLLDCPVSFISFVNFLFYLLSLFLFLFIFGCEEDEDSEG